MRTIVMARMLALGAAVVVLSLAVGGARLAGLAAQDASPEVPPITDTVLGQGMPADAPGMVLQFERITIEPGAAIPTHVHPGAYVIYVESGDFGFTVIKGEAQITYAGSTTPETIAAGTEVVAHPGDMIFENAGVVHSARNAGTTQVSVLTSALLIAGQPSLQPTNNEGTPAT